MIILPLIINRIIIGIHNNIRDNDGQQTLTSLLAVSLM